MSDLTQQSGVVGYARLSRDDADISGIPIEQKRKEHVGMLLHLAKLYKINLPEAAISWEVETAIDLDARPEFLSILGQCERKEIHTLVIMDIDRITRNIGDWARIEKAFFRGSIRLITARGDYTFNRNFDPAMLQMAAVFGGTEYYRFSFRKRLHCEQRIRQGKYSCGRAPYGYRWDRETKGFVIYSEEYVVIEEIFRRILYEGTCRIAKDLRARGAPPPGGGSRSSRNLGYWMPNAVRRIVANPFYAGFPTKRSERNRERKVVRLAPAEWIWADAEQDYPHPVDREQWEAIQEIISGRNHGEGGRTGLLTGTLKASCGNRMALSGKLYYCDCHYRGQGHRGGQIRAEVLERTVVDAIIDSWSRMERAIAPKRAAPVDSGAELLNLRRQERKLTAEIEKLQTDAVFLDALPGYGEQARKARQTALGAELLAVQTQIAENVKRKEVLPVDLPESFHQAVEEVGGIAAWMEQASISMRREFLRKVVLLARLLPVPDGRRNTPGMEIALRRPLGTGQPAIMPLSYNRYKPRKAAS